MNITPLNPPCVPIDIVRLILKTWVIDRNIHSACWLRMVCKTWRDLVPSPVKTPELKFGNLELSPSLERWIEDYGNEASKESKIQYILDYALEEENWKLAERVLQENTMVNIQNALKHAIITHNHGIIRFLTSNGHFLKYRNYRWLYCNIDHDAHHQGLECYWYMLLTINGNLPGSNIAKMLGADIYEPTDQPPWEREEERAKNPRQRKRRKLNN